MELGGEMNVNPQAETVLPANPSADGNGVRSPRHALQGMKLIRACDEEEDRFGRGIRSIRDAS